MAIQDKFDSAFTDKLLKKTLLSNKPQNLDASVANDNTHELTKSNLVTLSNSFTSLQNAFNKIYAHTLNVRNLHQYDEKRLANIKKENSLENKIAPSTSPVLNTGGDGTSLASTAATLDELASSVEKLNDKMKKINLSGTGYSNAMLLGDSVGTRSRAARLGGRALGVAGVGLDVYGRYQEGESAGQIATGVGSGLAGAALGAKGGAAAGAAVGAFFGGVGAVPGAAIGGFIGGIGGYFGGSMAGDAAYNALNTRATGGGVKAGGTYVIGERGPEVLMLGGLSGRVIANGQRGKTPQSEKYLTAAADRSSRAAAKVIKGQPPGPTSYSSKFSNYLGSLFSSMPNWLNRIKDYLGIGSDGPGGGGTLGSGQYAAVGDLSGVSGDWKNDTEFLTAIDQVARKYNIDANDLLGLIYHESAGTFSPTVRGKGSARGLFQFTRGGGFDPEHIVTLSRAEQVRLADEKIFAASGMPRGANAGQIYAAVFLPGIARQQGWQGVIARRGVNVPGVGDVYGSNPSLDNDRDGDIDYMDLASVISGKRVRMGLGTSPSMSSVEGTGGYVTRTGGSGAISGAYGTDRGTHRHEGIDISAPAGTPVASLAAGTVTRAEFSRSYGNVVYVQQDNGLEARYAHLRGFAPGIERNKRVGTGQILGYVGNTGESRGNHLHLELRRDDAVINPTETYNQNKWIVGGQVNYMDNLNNQLFNIPTGYRYEQVQRNGRDSADIITPNGSRFPFYVRSAEGISNLDTLSAQTRNEILAYFRLRGQ
jgi:murein DD-endopeptidase MepM/ murein hydrolase activator NlpD